MSDVLHVRIRSELEARIRSGEWPAGTRLPTEVQLQECYGVSRVTVQRALRDLATAGVVLRYRRKGTFVAQTAPEESLLWAVNLLAEGSHEDSHAPHRVVDARVIQAREAGIDLPGLAFDVPVARLERCKLDAAEAPVTLETQYVPFSVAPHLLDEPLETLVTLSYFRRSGIHIARARVYADPIALSPELAALFDQEHGRAVFRFRRLLWLESGELAEAASFILAENTQFYVEQTYPKASRSE